jgi:signal transduction histidine kinase
VEHLSQLINDLFELAQLDAGLLELRIEPSSVQDLISDTLESMSAQAHAQKLTLSGKVD